MRRVLLGRVCWEPLRRGMVLWLGGTPGSCRPLLNYIFGETWSGNAGRDRCKKLLFNVTAQLKDVERARSKNTCNCRACQMSRFGQEFLADLLVERLTTNAAMRIRLTD